MADLGHQLTDKKLDKLEKKIAKEYKTAVKEMEQKYKDYAKQTEKARKVQEKLYQAGEISFDDYVNWQVTHELTGSRWEQMKDVLAADMVHANDIAKGIIKGEMPDIFALNCNYETYSIEHGAGIDTSFVLYNHDTAMYLLGDQRQLMPKPSPKKAAEIAANKDMQWNKQKIQSAVLQGVLQGESPYEVAERLQQVGQMNYNSAVRYARTMGTSAQNAGRYEAFHRAKNLGVDLTIEWSATLDHRTRHSHRNMHGQRHEVDEPFIIIDGGKQYTIYYPADCTGASTAPQKEIWNCRCTLLSWVKGYEGDTVKESPKIKDMTFEEWQNGKKNASPPSGVVTQEPAKPTTPQVPIDTRFTEARKNAAKYYYDRNEADKYFRPILDENWDDMSEWEKYATWEYTHNSNPINKSLSGYHESWSRSNFIGVANTDWGHENRYRGFDHTPFRTKFGDADGHVQYHKVNTSLTTAIEKNAMRDDVWLFRGGGSGSLAGLLENGGFNYDDVQRVIEYGTDAEKEKLKQAIIGKEFQEHSFLSTGVAKDAGFTHKPVKYEIYAPKGTKGIYAEPQSYYGGTIGMKEKIYEKGHSWSGNVGSEAEVILQRGTTYRITDIEFTYTGANVKMEVVNQPNYFVFGDEDTFNNGATRHLR